MTGIIADRPIARLQAVILGAILGRARMVRLLPVPGTRRGWCWGIVFPKAIRVARCCVPTFGVGFCGGRSAHPVRIMGTGSAQALCGDIAEIGVAPRLIGLLPTYAQICYWRRRLLVHAGRTGLEPAPNMWRGDFLVENAAPPSRLLGQFCAVGVSVGNLMAAPSRWSRCCRRGSDVWAGGCRSWRASC